MKTILYSAQHAHPQGSDLWNARRCILSVESVTKYYGSEKNVTKALDGISFDVEAQEFVGVMGASGSGKTTLLRCMSTLDTVTAGYIWFDSSAAGDCTRHLRENEIPHRNITHLSEKEVARFRSENLGFVFQDYNLLDSLTLRENIELALTIRGKEERQIAAVTEATAAKLHINDILDKFPSEVSGGQKQRCACARAIVNKPSLLLADEPTGALDSKSSADLMETLHQLNETEKITILMVTHDAFAASHCSRILFLQDGRIYNELRRGNRTRKAFFQDILDVMSLLGGDVAHVR